MWLSLSSLVPSPCHALWALKESKVLLTHLRRMLQTHLKGHSAVQHQYIVIDVCIAACAIRGAITRKEPGLIE